MYSSFGGIRERKEERRAKAKELAEAKEMEEQAKISADNDETKDFKQKIYLIAGAVAVLGAVIIIIKTRKK